MFPEKSYSRDTVSQVTLVHRSTLQVWPRSVHYLMSTEKDRPFRDYAEVYEKAVSGCIRFIFVLPYLSNLTSILFSIFLNNMKISLFLTG